MPMYDYHCCGCGAFSALRPLSAYRDPMQCPTCGGETSRVISAPSLAVMTSGNRTAWERNERSAHEPRRSSCSSGRCGHAHHQTKPKTAAAPLSTNKKTNQIRPWMLGH